MLTINALREYGANVQEGLERCLNDEGFYLEMVRMALDEEGFKRLSDAIEAGDKKSAFEAAHALKGVLANVALTPLYEQVSEVTELLRAKKIMNAHKSRILVYFLCIVMALSIMMPLTAFAQESERKVVRVGWYESPFNYTDQNGRRSGYAYEYQQRIAAYTGWEYE